MSQEAAGSLSSGLFLGTISGTSVDGLDLALLEIGEDVRFLAATTTDIPAPLQATLLDLGQPASDDLDLLGSTDVALAEFISSAVLEFLDQQNIPPSRIIAIGSHGQTVRHRPDGEHPFTWQIGDPNVIAERTGITTVADFRRRDMAAGGQGAPLVPRFHQALFSDPNESRAILNIGGISNLTLLPAGSTGTISGFDCGPGNALLDSWCLQHLGLPFDQDGAWATSGSVNVELLDRLLRDPYLKRPPPKSTGREHYNLPWLEAELTGISAPAERAPAERAPAERAPAEDVQRTLLELTAVSIRDALARWAPAHQRLVVCGGGRLNSALMSRLSDLSEPPVVPSESLGYDGDAIEAGAFAWLAAQRLRQASGNAGSVTGARGERVLGGVYPA